MGTSGSTLREARTRARLTQVELAERAGVTQSVVSAYESHRREPSVGMLRSLVGAAGFELALELRKAAPTTSLRSLLDRRRTRLLRELSALGATNVRLFGSVARGTDGASSDVDLLVDVSPEVGLFALARMQSAAERILAVPVDVVPSNSLKPDLRSQVLAEAVPL